jgi:hypothetical protein
VLRERLAQEPEQVQARVQLVEADMRDFNLGRQFALAMTPFRPFQHLTTVADQIACLTTIRRHLQPGGQFILEVFNPSLPALTSDSVGEPFGEEPPFTLPDGRRVVRRHKIAARDYFRQVLSVELIYEVTHPDGAAERLVRAFDMRYLFRFEAEHLLARCGFAVERVYADFDKSAYGSKYPGELLLVARKEGA